MVRACLAKILVIGWFSSVSTDGTIDDYVSEIFTKNLQNSRNLIFYAVRDMKITSLLVCVPCFANLCGWSIQLVTEDW